MQNKTLEVFKNTLSHNVAQCPDEALLELAHAVWYKGCRITENDLEVLVAETDPNTLKRALCLLELISMLPVCPRETKKTLQRTIGKIHSTIVEQPEGKALPHCKLDVRWGIQDNIPHLLQTLLPFQKRHYASTQGQLHGFA